jgi:hypothetical protein
MVEIPEQLRATMFASIVAYYGGRRDYQYERTHHNPDPRFAHRSPIVTSDLRLPTSCRQLQK